MNKTVKLLLDTFDVKQFNVGLLHCLTDYFYYVYFHSFMNFYETIKLPKLFNGDACTTTIAYGIF